MVSHKINSKVDRRKYVKYAFGAIVAASAAVGYYYLTKPTSTPFGQVVPSEQRTTIETKATTSEKKVTVQNSVTEFPHKGTIPTMIGKVKVDGEEYSFNPIEVETVRPDLFNPGFFSVFDVLVHLEKKGLIDLEYHFDDSMNTHVIDSIKNEANWWYSIYYSGGWSERNVFRPDHYPWKDKTTLGFIKTSPEKLEDIYTVFREEVIRRDNNNGRLIVPKVIIRSFNFHEEFKNVEVTPHNMRYDVFKENVTTALDVILSLADKGKITYEIKWYDSIGSAEVVKDYWVEGINDDKAQGRCGYVYEAGSPKYNFFQGNHIHLPTDTRILNSPEYVEFFWICL